MFSQSYHLSWSVITQPQLNRFVVPLRLSRYVMYSIELWLLGSRSRKMGVWGGGRGGGGLWRGCCHLSWLGCSSNVVSQPHRSSFHQNVSYYSRLRPQTKQGQFYSLAWREIRVPLVACSCAFSETKLLCVDQVLERGPPVYHQVVLGMLCALMRLADFSSPAMRHFQNEALKTIAKYLKVNITC